VLAAVRSRGLCAPAAPAPIVTEIRDSIAEMKAALAAAPDAAVYTPEAFSAALSAGKVDISMLSSTLGSIDPSAKKLAMKCVTDTMAMEKESAMYAATMEKYDWSQWEKKGLDADLIAEVKAIMEEGVAKEKTMIPDLVKANGFAELEKEISEAFDGPGGFMELASAEEKAAMEGMAKALASMEKLEVDAVGIRDVTIAEILEREPELRAEIEEEIKNNNWGY